MRTMLFLTATCLSLSTTGAEEPAAAGLKNYVGKELWKLELSVREGFHRDVADLTGDKLESTDLRQSYWPWWVKPYASGRIAWMFMEVYPGWNVPDVSGVRIHLFDKGWKRVVKQEFPTGYRLRIKDVTLDENAALQQNLLVVRVVGSSPLVGEAERKEFYALSKENFVLVRLENEDGQPFRNSYNSRVPFIGPHVTQQSGENWIKQLRSDDPVEQLGALMWLTGRHLPSTEKRRENVNEESREDALIWESVRDAAETGPILQKLSESPHAWVRDYAKLALTKP